MDNVSFRQPEISLTVSFIAIFIDIYRKIYTTINNLFISKSFTFRLPEINKYRNNNESFSNW